MKKICIALLLAATFMNTSFANQDFIEQNKRFSGAEAHKEMYKAIYQLDTNNPDTIKKAIGNIKHLMEDTRLKNKILVEVVTYSAATDIMLKNSPFANELKELVSMGVILVQCENSLLIRKLNKDQFLDFIGYVPSANGELVIRASEGWIIIKP
jgi:uncharacterized protein